MPSVLMDFGSGGSGIHAGAGCRHAGYLPAVGWDECRASCSLCEPPSWENLVYVLTLDGRQHSICGVILRLLNPESLYNRTLSRMKRLLSQGNRPYTKLCKRLITAWKVHENGCVESHPAVESSQLHLPLHDEWLVRYCW